MEWSEILKVIIDPAFAHTVISATAVSGRSNKNHVQGLEAISVER